MSIIAILTTYAFAISFLVSLFSFGEEISIFLAILSGHGIVSFWKVFIGCFLGMLIADVFWFYFAKTRYYKRIRKRCKKSPHYPNIKRFLAKMEHKNLFLYFFINKFFCGLRTISIVRYSSKKGEILEFLKYDTLALFCWQAIFLSFGWFAGRGVTILLEIAKDFQKIAFISLIIILILYILEGWIKRRLLKENLKKKKR